MLSVAFQHNDTQHYGSVVMLRVFLPSVVYAECIKLALLMNVIMLNVIMLSVVVPRHNDTSITK